MNIKTKEVKKKKAKKGRRTNKRKLVHKEFGLEIANIFTEALGEIKIEKEAKRLKAEGKTLKDFTEEEIVNRYINWTVWEVMQLKKYMETKLKMPMRIL
ncbi:hypothetical protein R4Q14_03220 [Brachyspira intermedia]|uniref:hypothetical protein n=1 Tax=Brachyspira intermedia TaxID=84377 RepID=UPI003003ED05